MWDTRVDLRIPLWATDSVEVGGLDVVGSLIWLRIACSSSTREVESWRFWVGIRVSTTEATTGRITKESGMVAKELVVEL